MKLQYESHLADLAESNIRRFLRTETFRRQRLFSSLGAAVGFTGVLYLYIRNSEVDARWSIILVFSVVLAITCFLAYAGIVRRKIFKNVEREFGSMLPSTTIYIVEQQHLSCSNLGVVITFSLDDLESVSENADYIEVSFGKRGLCVVPVRAFNSDSHKSAFMSSINKSNRIDSLFQSPLGSESDLTGGNRANKASE